MTNPFFLYIYIYIYIWDYTTPLQYMGIMISHDKDPYNPISIMKCHMGFEHCSFDGFLMILLTNKNPPKKLSIDIFPIVGPLRVCVKTAVRTEKSHVICAKSNLWSFGMAQYFGCHSSQTHCWEPENGGPLEKGNSYWKAQFSGSYLIFQPVVTSKNPTKLPCGGNPNKSVVKIHEGNGIN